MSAADEAARAEGRRLWPRYSGDNGYPITRWDVFQRGARWQRSQPIEVTEEMVIAAAEEIRRYAYPNIARTSPPGLGWMDQARAALTAALGAAKEPEKK